MNLENFQSTDKENQSSLTNLKEKQENQTSLSNNTNEQSSVNYFKSNTYPSNTIEKNDPLGDQTSSFQNVLNISQKTPFYSDELVNELNSKLDPNIKSFNDHSKLAFTKSPSNVISQQRFSFENKVSSSLSSLNSPLHKKQESPPQDEQLKDLLSFESPLIQPHHVSSKSLQSTCSVQEPYSGFSFSKGTASKIPSIQKISMEKNTTTQAEDSSESSFPSDKKNNNRFLNSSADDVSKKKKEDIMLSLNN